jgi:phytoene dehydrogenase-like protein
VSDRRVIVVGAGVAGLRCAQVLDELGIGVTVVDRSERVGGRIATDVIDGFRIDRGFQLLNPSYPQVGRALDLAPLRLRAFAPGMVLCDGARSATVADPLRRPLRAFSDLVAPIGPLASRAALVRLLARLRLGSVRRARVDPDRSAEQWLLDQQISHETINKVLRPFLAGVLLEERLETSATITALLLRSFLRGVPGVPEMGMAAIAEQMAARLPAGAVQLEAPVRDVLSDRVVLEDGTALLADRVVVATGALAAKALVPSFGARLVRSTTTWWYSTTEPTKHGAMLVVDQAMGTLVNSVEMTAAAPTYGPPGRHLVAASALGLHPEIEAERAVRERLSALHKTSTRSWELIAMSLVPDALPVFLPGTGANRAIEIDGIVLAGDHMASPSTQGAMASGERAARHVARR